MLDLTTVAAIAVPVGGVAAWFLRRLYNDLRAGIEAAQDTADRAIAKADDVEDDVETLTELLVDSPHDAAAPLLERVVDRLDRIEAEQRRLSRLVTENTHSIQRIAAALEAAETVPTAVEDGEVHFPDADVDPPYYRGGSGRSDTDRGSGPGSDLGDERGRHTDGGVPLPDDGRDRAD